jgi:phenylacetate-CoA ligase
VRGVNLFPSAIRSILKEFAPEVGGGFQIRPKSPGVSQLPPLPVVIELGKGLTHAPERLREAMVNEFRERLLVTTQIEFVPYGTLPRETYKTKLVAYDQPAISKEAASH